MEIKQNLINFYLFLRTCIQRCSIVFCQINEYSIIIFGFSPHPVNLECLIFHPTPLFGPIFYEIYIEYPPYSFIWHYLFNWHLRVDITPLQKRRPIKKVMACLLRDRSAQIRPSPNQLPHFMECCFLSFSSSPLNI